MMSELRAIKRLVIIVGAWTAINLGVTVVGYQELHAVIAPVQGLIAPFQARSTVQDRIGAVCRWLDSDAPALVWLDRVLGVSREADGALR